jgi:hypothetical protein
MQGGRLGDAVGKRASERASERERLPGKVGSRSITLQAAIQILALTLSTESQCIKLRFDSNSDDLTDDAGFGSSQRSNFLYS